MNNIDSNKNKYFTDSHLPVNDQRVASGPAIAATLAPILGFYTLMISHHVSRLSKEWDRFIHSYGHWIPGSTGTGPDGSIGSYSGKETLALMVWLITWGVFHFLWRKQDLPLDRWFPVFLGSLGIVTLGFFHPFADPIVIFLRDLFG